MKQTKSFSDKLKEYRKQLNYTQEKMAKFLNFSVKSIQAWEQGKRKPPRTYQEMILEKILREIHIQKFGKED